jgi:hypothetical protein
MAERVYKRPFKWIAHGPQGERKEFIGGRNHEPKALRDYLLTVPDPECWVVESFAAGGPLND